MVLYSVLDTRDLETWISQFNHLFAKQVLKDYSMLDTVVRASNSLSKKKKDINVVFKNMQSRH